MWRQTSELEDRTKENRHAAMKSIIMQTATHCSVLQFNYIPTNWKGSIGEQLAELPSKYILFFVNM